MGGSKTEKNLLIGNYWFWVLVVVVVGSFFVFFKVNLPANRYNLSYLTLDFGNGAVKQFQGQIFPGMTVLEALNSASMGGHFDFRYSITDDGVLKVTKIGDIANLGDNTSWHFYLNGVLLNVSDISQTAIKAGDKIEARYEQRR